MDDESPKKTIGESTPITIGLLITIVGVGIATGKALQTQDEHDRRISQNSDRITAVEKKAELADERANKTGTDLELLKQDSRYTRAALDEALRKLDVLISGGGVRSSGGRMPR